MSVKEAQNTSLWCMAVLAIRVITKVKSNVAARNGDLTCYSLIEPTWSGQNKNPLLLVSWVPSPPLLFMLRCLQLRWSGLATTCGLKVWSLTPHFSMSFDETLSYPERSPRCKFDCMKQSLKHLKSSFYFVFSLSPKATDCEPGRVRTTGTIKRLSLMGWFCLESMDDIFLPQRMTERKRARSTIYTFAGLDSLYVDDDGHEVTLVVNWLRIH